MLLVSAFWTRPGPTIHSRQEEVSWWWCEGGARVVEYGGQDGERLEDELWILEEWEDWLGRYGVGASIVYMLHQIARRGPKELRILS